MAKSLKQAPKKIAAELVEAVGEIAGVAAMEVAGNGYHQSAAGPRRLSRAGLLAPAVDESGNAAAAARSSSSTPTSIPNKAAHIGHLRNAVLGDTFVRMLRARGNRVEVQNYIDNTGVQVADVVVGFHFLEKKTPAEVTRADRGDTALRLPLLGSSTRARRSITRIIRRRLRGARKRCIAIEAGAGELAELAHLVADAIVKRISRPCCG